MARIRTIKPEFWKDEDLSELPELTHLFAAALLNYSDDEGYFNANPKLIKAELFPLREPSLSIHGMLNELSNIGYLTLFSSSDGKFYGLVNNFTTHQKINRPTKSKIAAITKDCAVLTELSVSPHGRLIAGKERKGKEQGTGKGIMSGKPDVGGENPPAEPEEQKPDPAEQAIEYLNEKTGRNYRLVESNLKFVRARINEGFTLDDLLAVVDRQCAEWTGTKWAQYLRPATLFNGEKFNQYIALARDPTQRNHARELEDWLNEGADFIDADYEAVGDAI